MAETKDILKYLRKKKGLTQRELADRIGVSYSTIGNYESGIRLPDSAIEELLADFFDVSIDYLRGKVQGAELSRLEYDKAKNPEHYAVKPEDEPPFPVADYSVETTIGRIMIECKDMNSKQLNHLLRYIKLYKEDEGGEKS